APRVSKSSRLTCPQSGQGTWTEAAAPSAALGAAVPVHFKVTVMERSQQQQAKVKDSWMSIALGSPGRRRRPRRRGGGGAAPSLTLALGAVLGPRLFAVGDALGVEHAADDVVADAGQVADAAAAHQDDRVLLEVVPLAGDVGGHLDL